jgi:hypothetical protein
VRAENLWLQRSHQLLREKEQANQRLLKATESARQCLTIAHELGLSPPSFDEHEDAEYLMSAIEEWRSKTLERQIITCFWTAHHPFLTGTRNRSAPPLPSSRERKLTQLINSARGCHAPELAEVRELSRGLQSIGFLCKAYGDVMKETRQSHPTIQLLPEGHSG